MSTNSAPTTSSTTPFISSARGATKSTPVAAAGVSSVKPGKSQKAAPSQAAIAQKAYEIWLARGQEPGCEQKHWFEAEQQLRRA
jgi:hypothetical protein